MKKRPRWLMRAYHEVRRLNNRDLTIQEIDELGWRYSRMAAKATSLRRNRKFHKRALNIIMGHSIWSLNELPAP